MDGYRRRLMGVNQRGGTATVVSGIRETGSSWEKPFTVTPLSILGRFLRKPAD